MSGCGHGGKPGSADQCGHGHHGHHDHTQMHAAMAQASPAYKKVLWAALLINAAMFALEISMGLASHSVSLLADSLDFFGDAANYAVSLFVLGMAPSIRAKTALIKGASLGLFGAAVLAVCVYNLATGRSPQPWTMSLVAMLALAANVAVALMLYRWRDGDANMRSVWLCSRNDAIGNVAVLGAAGLVAWTNSPWPDLAVAVLMAVLALAAAKSIVAQALQELKN